MKAHIDVAKDLIKETMGKLWGIGAFKRVPYRPPKSQLACRKWMKQKKGLAFQFIADRPFLYTAIH